jgi:DNA-directed RNA polymerase alpha subunit
MSIEKLKLNRRILNALGRANIRTVSDLVQCNRKKLLRLHSIGIRSLLEIYAALSEFGLTLKD